MFACDTAQPQRPTCTGQANPLHRNRETQGLSTSRSTAKAEALARSSLLRRSTAAPAACPASLSCCSRRTSREAHTSCTQRVASAQKDVETPASVMWGRRLGQVRAAPWGVQAFTFRTTHLGSHLAVSLELPELVKHRMSSALPRCVLCTAAPCERDAPIEAYRVPLPRASVGMNLPQAEVPKVSVGCTTLLGKGKT